MENLIGSLIKEAGIGRSVKTYIGNLTGSRVRGDEAMRSFKKSITDNYRIAREALRKEFATGKYSPKEQSEAFAALKKGRESLDKIYRASPLVKDRNKARLYTGVAATGLAGGGYGVSKGIKKGASLFSNRTPEEKHRVMQYKIRKAENNIERLERSKGSSHIGAIIPGSVIGGLLGGVTGELIHGRGGIPGLVTGAAVGGLSGYAMSEYDNKRGAEAIKNRIEKLKLKQYLLKTRQNKE